MSHKLLCPTRHMRPKPEMFELEELLKTRTIQEIADEFGRKSSTVYNWCSTYGVSAGKRPSEKAMISIAKNMTSKEAAIFLNAKEGTVRVWARRYGLHFRRAEKNHNCALGLSRQLVEEIVGFYHFGLNMNVYKIALVLQMPIKSVRYTISILMGYV